MKILELKVPPVFVFLLCIALIYWADNIASSLEVQILYRYAIFVVCFVASGYFGLAGIYEFKKAKTSVHPIHVHKATKVVDGGVYRYSRNPMYLGLLLLLLGWAAVLQNLLGFVVCLLFILYMTVFQIVPEEKHLAEKFGDEYENYKKTVRRWI